MRITEIEGFDILPPFQDFNAVAINRYHGVGLQRRGILVVKTDNGLEGYGENWGGLPDVDALRAEYVGTDPFDWMGALVDLPMCMANYDLMGKYLGVPAWRLIGPKVRSWVPVSAWTVSQKPDDMAEEVRQAAQRGYHWIKYHLDEVQNVIEQTAAMQEVAPPGFKVHYDFNANLDFYTMCPIIQELERFPVAGRVEDVMAPGDEEGFRLLREKCKLPIIVHHGPAEFMVKNLCDGFMSGHSPVGMAAKLAAVAEMTRKPIMLQNAGGVINQAFLAHQAAVFKMATIDHVNLCHMWKDDVTIERMPVIGGSVEVPDGPGLGVTLDRDKLELYARTPEPDYGRFLVRLRYVDGLQIYLRHNPNLPGCTDNLRFHERLHGFQVPTRVPSYNSPLVTDFWDESEDSSEFERIWQKTESGPVWINA